MPEGAGPALPHRAVDAASSVEDALHVLDLMVDAVTLDSTAVGERAARVVAEHLGDTAFVYRRSAAGVMVVVYAAHRDPDDLVFVESIAARVAHAAERARCWTAAWEMRRAMVAALGSLSFEGDCFDAWVESMSSGDPEANARDPLVPEPVVAVLDPELRHVACSKAYAALVGEDATRLTGVTLRSIVRDGGSLDEALAPVLLGEIDFRSVELEVLTDQVRVALHVAMVRYDDVTPRGVVVVAHPVPALSSG